MLCSWHIERQVLANLKIFLKAMIDLKTSLKFGPSDSIEDQ